MQHHLALKNRKCFSFQVQDAIVEFSSSFQCGNLGSVTQTDPSTYNICGQPDTEQTAKSCLYFSVKGFPIGSRVKMRLCRMDILSSFYAAEASKERRPDTSYQFCYRQGHSGEWQRMLEGSSLEMAEEKQLVLAFSFTFWTNHAYEFSFNYPYSVSKLQKYLEVLRLEHQNSQIYYNDQTLAQSRQNHNLHLITISNSQRDISTKPVILITGRVHPSESPSSFVVQGIVNFLLNKNDLRSHILRQTFTIMVIPMLNPDGVAMGNFRYDDLGQNLNRYYLDPTQTNQPSIVVARNVINELNGRLLFYFDLHAHHSPKGCFIYSNAFDDFTKQVEARVFCKAMSINNCDFEYQSCNHSPEHMVCKDKKDILSKEGCGRVYAYKAANVWHSYTVECGHYRGQPNEPTRESNVDYQQGQPRPLCCTPTPNSGCERIYRPCNYREIGRDLMITVLDVLSLNPYTRIANSQFRQMEALRRIVSSEIYYSELRFRKMQQNIKLKNINGLVGGLYDKWAFLRGPRRDDRQEREKPPRASTQLRYSNDFKVDKRLSSKEEDIAEDQLIIRRSHPIYTEAPSTKPAEMIQKGSRYSFTPALCNNKNSSCSPIRLQASFSKSEIKLIISERDQQPQKKQRTHPVRVSTRKIIKTEICLERKVETETEIEDIRTPHKQPNNFEFKVVAVDEARKDIIIGRENSLMKAYENAKKRAVSKRVQEDSSTKEIFKLPKLQNLVEVKARIIQQCRLEHILNPNKFKS